MVVQGLKKLADVFNPPVSTLAKIGSILVHVEEGAGEDGHAFDWIAVRSLLADKEVQEWLAGMGKHAMLPVRRNKVEKRSIKKADCKHEWSAWKEIGRTGDWFHPVIVERKCKKCGSSETDEH